MASSAGHDLLSVKHLLPRFVDDDPGLPLWSMSAQCSRNDGPPSSSTGGPKEAVLSTGHGAGDGWLRPLGDGSPPSNRMAGTGALNQVSASRASHRRVRTLPDRVSAARRGVHTRSGHQLARPGSRRRSCRLRRSGVGQCADHCRHGCADRFRGQASVRVDTSGLSKASSLTLSLLVWSDGCGSAGESRSKSGAGPQP